MPNYNDMIWCHFGLGRPPTVGALRFLPSVSDVAGSTCEPPRAACSRSELDQINSTNLKRTSFRWFAIIVESAFILHGFTLPGKSRMSSSWWIASSGVISCDLILLSIHSGISRKRCQVLRAWVDC